MSGISPTNRYSCERLSPAPHLSPNADLISQLQIIKKERAMEHGTDSHEYMAYANAISALNSWPTKIRSVQDVTAIPCCEEKITALVGQYSKEGRLEQADRIKRDPRFLAMKEFTKIWGVGGVKAREFYDKDGYRTLRDVREDGKFPNYFPYLRDVETSMTRHDVESVAAFVKVQAIKSAKGDEIQMEICGGYRRGATEMTDVDLLFTFPNNEGRERGFLKRLLHRLEVKRLIPSGGILSVQYTATERDSQQTANVPATMLDCLDRCFLIFKHPANASDRPGDIYHRVDIVIVNWNAWGTATLAWTGSTQFNRDIRKVAKSKGWSLDAGGLMDKGRDIACVDERDVFTKLGLDYIPPEMRHADA